MRPRPEFVTLKIETRSTRCGVSSTSSGPIITPIFTGPSTGLVSYPSSAPHNSRHGPLVDFVPTGGKLSALAYATVSLFDVDRHWSIGPRQERVDLCHVFPGRHTRRNDVRLAISNPCFELWLALHCVDHTRWLDTEAAGKLRRDQDGSTGKGLDSATYMSRRADAARRARSLTAKHEGDGTIFPDDNPSSGMYLFLEAIEPKQVRRGGDPATTSR